MTKNELSFQDSQLFFYFSLKTGYLASSKGYPGCFLVQKIPTKIPKGSIPQKGWMVPRFCVTFW